MKKVQLWNYFDVSVKNNNKYENPYSDVSLTATFTNESGTSLVLKGFWNGGNEWKLRFAPNELGVWSYVATFSDGSKGAKGKIEAVEYLGENELYKHGFLKVSDNNRYLTFNDGTPFFWLADTHWLGLGKRERFYESNSPLFKTMFHGEANYRSRQGFTVYQMNFFVSGAGDCDGVGTSNEGGNIWQGEAFEKINPGFFKNCDERIAYLNSIGIVPCLGVDWGRTISSENIEGFKKITSYIVARYSAFSVTWFIAGEFGGSKEWQLWGELGELVENEDAYAHVTTIHGCGENFVENPDTAEGPLADAFRNEKWYDMTMIQSGHLPRLMNRNVWRYYFDKNPAKPLFEAEQAYEGIWEVREPITREQAYLSIMHGGFGTTYGAEGVWDATWDTNDKHQVVPPWWPIPWYDAILLPGATQMGYMRKCFENVSWWKLMPGEFLRITNPLNTMAETVAKVAPDKSEALVYFTGWKGDYTTDVYLKELNVGDKYASSWYNTVTAEITDAGELEVDQNGEMLLPKRQVAMYDRMLILKKK